MKFQSLPVKRRPVSKGILHRFHAITTRNRRQRVAAAAASAEIEDEHHGSKISRSLTIIFLIHIVAIALIFIHHQFLHDRMPGSGSTASHQQGGLPQISNGDKRHIVRTGDNYARIAAAEQVDEADLRAINKDVDIRPGLILKIPPRRIVAEEPPEVAAIREQSQVSGSRGQVVDVDVSDAPRAVLVRPAAGPPASSATGGRHHVVQPGESVYGIAKQFGISQDALMKANGIDDPRKLRAGARLSIPSN
jgi:membrane-bound lytic murein transglycosylase D